MLRVVNSTALIFISGFSCFILYCFKNKSLSSLAGMVYADVGGVPNQNIL